MSQSKVVQNYKGYEIVALRGTFWVACISSIDKTVEYTTNKEVIVDAIKCDEATKMAKQFIDDHQWNLIDSKDNFKFYVHLKFNGEYEYKISSDSCEELFPVDSREVAQQQIKKIVENCEWKFIHEVHSFSIYIKLTPFYGWVYKIEKENQLVDEVSNLKTEEDAIKHSLENINERMWEYPISYSSFTIYARQNIKGLFDYKTNLDEITIEMDIDFSDKQLMLITAIGRADKYYQKLKKQNHQV